MAAIAWKNAIAKAEVTFINKQRFLAELGKLLTFMYEEDRLRALEMYSRMFEEAEDENALIQALVSPTKQAVVVARAYNSNLGKFSVPNAKAAPEDRDSNGTPDYVQAIETVREKAYALQPRKEEPAESEDENQLNLFEQEEEELGGEAAEESAAAEETAETERTAEEAAGPETGDESAADAEVSEPDGEEPPAPAAAEEDKAAAEAEAAAKTAPEGIEFFSMPDEVKPEEEAAHLEESVFNIDTDLMRQTRRKPKVFALIVYILFAIPITLAAIAVLLIPALLFLALSVGAIICGVVTVSAAFNGFAVFADIMVVLGLALVLFALGLLFLWTAIWFVGGAIVGLVHGVAALCDKWCYKEVQV